MLEQGREDKRQPPASLKKHEEREMIQAPAKHRGSENPHGAQEEYAGYEVLDPLGQKIGSVEKLFFNRNGGLEYVRVRIGFLFTRHVLIPVHDAAALDRTARSPDTQMISAAREDVS